MKKTLALFDFDHTLYSKDSLIEFTRFVVGNTTLYTGLAKLSPQLAAMKLGLLNNGSTKQKYLIHFFRGIDYKTFSELASEFSLNHIDKDLDIHLKKTLQKHIDNNDTVYIVSASFTEWLEPWCSLNKIGLISSKLEVVNNKLTGKIAGTNCYGPEKAAKISNAIDITTYDSIYVYGKGKGDKEMMLLKKNN